MQNDDFSSETFAIYFIFFLKGVFFFKNYNLVKVSQKILGGFELT